MITTRREVKSWSGQVCHDHNNKITTPKQFGFELILIKFVEKVKSLRAYKTLFDIVYFMQNLKKNTKNLGKGKYKIPKTNDFFIWLGEP